MWSSRRCSSPIDDASTTRWLAALIGGLRANAWTTGLDGVVSARRPREKLATVPSTAVVLASEEVGDEVADARLAVGAGHADREQVARRVLEERRRQRGERRAAVGHDPRRRVDGHRALGDDGGRAAGDGGLDVVVAVGLDAAVRDEQHPGLDESGIVGDARDHRVARRAATIRSRGRGRRVGGSPGPLDAVDVDRIPVASLADEVGLPSPDGVVVRHDAGAGRKLPPDPLLQFEV